MNEFIKEFRVKSEKVKGHIPKGHPRTVTRVGSLSVMCKVVEFQEGIDVL